jgi:NitT/TauT family transport system substrate-binding protein
MFRRMFRLTWLLTALVFFAVPAIAQSPPQKVTFLTNYTFAGRDTPYFVGVAKGFFRTAGFDVAIEPTTGSGFVVTAIDSGKADFGMADPGSVIKGVANGAKIKAFMVFMDNDTSGLASLKPYPTPQALYGTSIAAAETDSARVILPIIFHNKGLDISKIHWIAADPSVYVSLLLSGRVDLYTASLDGDIPALEAIVASQNKKVYFDSFADWGYNPFGYLLITQASRVAGNRDEVQRFAGAIAKSVAWSVANPDEAAAIMAKANPTLKIETVRAQWLQSIKAIETPYVKQHGYGIATRERVEHVIDQVNESIKLPRKPTASEVFAEGMVGN